MTILEDTIKFITIYTVIHILDVAISDSTDLLSSKFLLITLYATIGIVIYHLFIKKLNINKLKNKVNRTKNK